MHKEILSKKQLELLPLVKKFSPDFGLVGGTAIALHLGHRRSIDFDLFTNAKLHSEKIRNTLRENGNIENTLVDTPEELTVVVNSVKFTFYEYPFRLKFNENFGGTIKLPTLTTLAAMKAFALGRRAKWKDYVDLYFVLKKQGMQDTLEKASKVFGGEFNEKLFRTQLAYFEDIDYSEEVDFMPGFEISKGEIKESLKDFSLQE